MNYKWAADDKQPDVIWAEEKEDKIFNNAFPGKRLIKWICPACDAENLDSPDLTALPVCCDCERFAEWEDFIGLVDIAQEA